MSTVSTVSTVSTLSPLRALAEAVFRPLDALLAALPLEAAPWCAVALLTLPVLVVARLPARSVLRGAPDERRWRDLRWWAAAVTLPYVLIYWFGG